MLRILRLLNQMDNAVYDSSVLLPGLQVMLFCFSRTASVILPSLLLLQLSRLPVLVASIAGRSPNSPKLLKHWCHASPSEVDSACGFLSPVYLASLLLLSQPSNGAFPARVISSHPHSLWRSTWVMHNILKSFLKNRFRCLESSQGPSSLTIISICYLFSSAAVFWTSRNGLCPVGSLRVQWRLLHCLLLVYSRVWLDLLRN